MTSRHHESHELTMFVHYLKDGEFEGDIGSSYAERLIAATDNSIYEQMPKLSIYPKHGKDLTLAVEAAQQAQIPLSPRGGGTGTNAQSLTQGVMVDVSRYMDQIIEYDPEKLTVRVQPGVILSRLNAFLKPYGVFFPPMVSTATRATIGGMIATDASGKGSRIYGKTSDYVEALNVVLSDGSSFCAKAFTQEETQTLLKGTSRASIACRELYRVVTEQQDEIERVFPKMNRGLTGYNLQKICLESGEFDPIRLFAGSEGTLALTEEIVLRVKKIPTHRSLLIVRYDDFDAALQHIKPLLSSDPLAIEVLDDRLLDTARDDASWSTIKEALGGETEKPVRGINFVEFAGDDISSLEQHLKQAKQLSSFPGVIDCHTVVDPAVISQLWELRAKAVGLLGRPRGNKQGVPFVEDTAVPPDNLPAYVRDFRRVLDNEQLDYGMFGHADVGCLHVRPFLNMQSPEDQRRIRRITDKVAQLTHHYGGLLWGEHGRGVRGEFSPLFFGETLFSELCRIKKAFDPNDLFNRGKLVPVDGHHVLKIDEIPFRGTFDASIKEKHQDHYREAIHCNGNGTCFNQEPDIIMCPSYKGTKDRLQSPKGRAALLREWLRLSATPRKNKKAYRSFLSSVKRNLDTCLACKACSSQCPIRVDIPKLRSRFYSEYYRFRVRALKDYLILFLEPLLTLGRCMPRLTNFGMQNSLSKKILSFIGLVDLPSLSPATLSSSAQITDKWLQDGDRSKKVVILQDSFTGSFDGTLVEDAYSFLRKLGYDVRVTPVLNNGKACHVKGFRQPFLRTAKKIIQAVSSITQNNIPVITLDPATGLMFEHEYRDEYGEHLAYPCSPEKFLYDRREDHKGILSEKCDVHFISHCTSQALTPGNGQLWSHVMSSFGISMTQKKLGCCGMAGLFGHEKENADLSKKIFRQHWRNHVDSFSLAEGFSCRCQSERMTDFRPLHPLQFLNRTVFEETAAE